MVAISYSEVIVFGGEDSNGDDSYKTWKLDFEDLAAGWVDLADLQSYASGASVGVAM